MPHGKKKKRRSLAQSFTSLTDDSKIAAFLADRETIEPVDDEFIYEVMIGNIRLRLMQTIFNGVPLRNNQSLMFTFGTTETPADIDAALFDSHYSDSKIAFDVRHNDTPDSTVDFKFINVPYAQLHEGWGRNATLTPDGEIFIKCLLGQRTKLLEIAGLEKDHTVLETTLSEIEKAYTNKKLHVGYWGT